jgi:hypothetical protein
MNGPVGSSQGTVFWRGFTRLKPIPAEPAVIGAALETRSLSYATAFHVTSAMQPSITIVFRA